MLRVLSNLSPLPGTLFDRDEPRHETGAFSNVTVTPPLSQNLEFAVTTEHEVRSGNSWLSNYGSEG